MSQTQMAFVFPGQGSQSVGMLAALAEGSELVRASFDQASAAIDVDLWDLAQHGPEERLNRTDLTQPALLAAGVAVWRLWCERTALRPAVLSGHSLGEYTALVCAGALSLADGARLVHARGRYMQEAVPEGVGAMAAVLGAEEAVIAEVCAQVAGDEVVAPANYNSPGQVVIAGHAAAIDRAIAALAARGVRKAVRLAVSVPSHCALMRAAAERLAREIQGLAWSMPAIPVVQNTDARVHADLAGIQDALVRQLYQPVRWTACVAALQGAGATRLGECGPGKVLAGLARRIDKGLDARALGAPEDLESALAAWT